MSSVIHQWNGPRRYGATPPPPRIADLTTFMGDDPYGNDTGPLLLIVFLDGSQLTYRNIKSEDWDYAVPCTVTVMQGKVEHVFPMAQVAYIRWREGN